MINLTKGQGIDLTKKGSTLKRVNVALGWAEAKKGIFGFLKEENRAFLAIKLHFS